MPKIINQSVENKLDTVINLLRHLLVLNLAGKGATQDAICKNLHITKAKVVEMLKGIKKDNK